MAHNDSLLPILRAHLPAIRRTRRGKPYCSDLARHAGRRVSAAERDAAWAAYQASTVQAVSDAAMQDAAEHIAARKPSGIDWRREYNNIAHSPRRPSKFDDLRPEDFGEDDHCHGTDLHASAPALYHEAFAEPYLTHPHRRRNLKDIAKMHWPVSADRKGRPGRWYPYPKQWRSRYADGTETPRSIKARKAREEVLRAARAKIAAERERQK